jgi:hypothetical protein
VSSEQYLKTMRRQCEYMHTLLIQIIADCDADIIDMEKIDLLHRMQQVIEKQVTECRIARIKEETE